MKFEDHCAESLKLFGETFDYVHRWLDKFAFVTTNYKTKFNAHHRKHRHHLAGAEEVRKQWGDKAYEAAIRHIISDFVHGEGFKEDRDELPKDEQDYIRKGFF